MKFDLIELLTQLKIILGSDTSHAPSRHPPDTLQKPSRHPPLFCPLLMPECRILKTFHLKILLEFVTSFSCFFRNFRVKQIIALLIICNLFFKPYMKFFVRHLFLCKLFILEKKFTLDALREVTPKKLEKGWQRARLTQKGL